MIYFGGLILVLAIGMTLGWFACKFFDTEKDPF